MTSLFPGEQPVSFAHIAVERGIDRYPDGLTYGVPPDLRDLAPGERVIVPLGSGDRSTAGVVVEIEVRSNLDPGAVKLIDKRDARTPRLPVQLLQLAKWISGYYIAPIGVTIAAMMPAAVKKHVGEVSKRMIDLGDPLPLDEKLPAKQRAVLETLASMQPNERPIEMRELAERADLRTTGPIARLLERGLLEESHRTKIEAHWAKHIQDVFVPDALTPAQRAIVEEIAVALNNGFSTHMLFGVTGSGKTEVYIRLIERVLAMGKKALMLVPEISLTPQTGGRLIGRFPGKRIAILHSALTAAQRHQQWALAARGEADIILGARSAIFAPVEGDSLGLIIVDEEHDGSYKQDQAPRYHGRDVAIRRAQLSNCPVLIGSATPSLESWYNATERGTYVLHELRERVPGMRLPHVKVVDFREQIRARKERGVHLIGPIMEHAIARALDESGQVILLLNRRGYANYIACPDQHCAWVMTCDDCDVTMVYHRSRELPTGGFVQCHHCLAEQKLPSHCPDCGKNITTFGLGTQRVEEEIHRKFPALADDDSIVRVDSDTMHSARDFHDVLERFGRGDIRMLVGTQMIAKGLDFPGVRVVGVINADTSINLPDFRASERTFQLVNQVAGRCGRSTDPTALGQVIVQSFNPGVPAISFAAVHDFRSFAQQEIAERAAVKLPPISRMTRIVVRDNDFAKVQSDAHELAERIRELVASEFGQNLPGAGVRVRGPSPCPISRIAGRHRQQIVLLAPTAVMMQSLLTEARNRRLLKPGEGMVIDVDPTALL